MISERMLEFLSLAEILNHWTVRCNKITIDGVEHDWNRVYSKYITLAKELLSPYVINKNSKE